MDDRWVQFALFLGIAAALVVLVVVGLQVVQRAVAMWRNRRAVRDNVATGQDPR